MQSSGSNDRYLQILTVLEICSVATALALLYIAYFHCEDPTWQVTNAYAHMGSKEAQYTLAQKYFQGVGVRKNRTAAFQWFRKAADQGHPEASYNLAVGYFLGYPAGLQPGEAHHYMKQAASKGLPEAKRVMDSICSRGHCVT